MNNCICLALELQMNQILILYWDESDSHPVLKKLKAYLQKRYLYMWKEKKSNTQHTKRTDMCVMAASIGRGGPWQGLWKLRGSEDRWNNKDNAWKYCKLKEEARSFHGTGSRPAVLKWGTQGNIWGKGSEDKLSLLFKGCIQRNKKLEL